MNNISQSLVDSMQILLDNSIQNQKNATILTCRVTDLKDDTIGMYEINYLGQTLTAYSNNISIKYSKDDEVYVISKDGSLTSTLVIIGSVTPYTGSTEKTPPEAEYIRIADSVFYNVNDRETIELCTYQSPQEMSLSLNLGAKFNTLFKSYADDYGMFCFSAKVRTNIVNLYQRVKGNYGLILSIPFVKSNEEGVKELITKDFILDIDKFLGDPYNYQEFTEQKIYINFKEEVIGYSYDTTRIPTLKAFCKDFKYDSSITEPDIFIDDIVFYPVDKVSSEKLTGYYLSLIASEGNYFITDRTLSYKIITPDLYIDGKKIISSKYDHYWFVEDSSVTPLSSNYSIQGGAGWRCLNTYDSTEGTDGSAKQLLNLKQEKLKIEKSSIKTSLRYKCVLNYNGNAISQIIKIVNLDSNADIELSIQKSDIIIENSEIKLDCKITLKNNDYIDNQAAFVYNLARYDKNNNYIDNGFYTIENLNELKQIDESTKQYTTTFSFPAEIIKDDINVFVCTVYLQNQGIETLYGNSQITLTVYRGKDFYLSIDNGDKIYKYDADGDSPRSADYDGPIESAVSTINPIFFKVYKYDGTEFTNTEYNYCNIKYSLPKNSMMIFDIEGYKEDSTITLTEDENYYYIERQGRFAIAYDILNSFNNNKLNNSIIISVNVNGSDWISGNANIQFLKEGETGTNGTKFSAILKYKGYSYGVMNESGIPQKLQLVYAGDSKKWYVKDVLSNLVSDLEEITDEGLVSLNGNPTFEVEVYENGSLIADVSKYTILQWSLFDEIEIQPYFKFNENGVLILNKDIRYEDLDLGTETLMYEWEDPNEVRATIVEAKIQVTDTSRENFNQNMYVQYPIETTRVDTLDDLFLIPTINGGFSSVLYATDGSNPKYDSSTNFVFSNGNYTEGMQNYLSKTWSCSEDLILPSQDYLNNICICRPVNKRDDALCNNYIKVSAIAEEKAEEARAQKEEYETIYNDLESEIENYQTELELLYKIGDVLRDNPITSLVSNYDIMSYREKGLNYIKKLQIFLEDFYNFFTTEPYGSYFAGKTMELDYEEIYDKLADEENGYITIAKNRLYNLINNGNFSSLPPLALESAETGAEDAYIRIEDREYEEIKSLIQVGNNTSPYRAINTLKEIVNNYNKNIDYYYEVYQNLTKKEDNEYIYQDELDEIQGYLEVINGIINLKVIPSGTLTVLNALISIRPDFYNNWANNFLIIASRFSDSNVDLSYSSSFEAKISIPLFQNLLNCFLVEKDILGSHVVFDETGKIKLSNNILNKIYNPLQINLDILSKAESDKIQSGGIYNAIAAGISLIHVRPIIFKLNTYESSYLNDWNGNKLYLNDNNDYLLAPMLGAGRKNDDNTFTGLTMGIKKFGNNANRSQVGLFGYSKGKQSIFLDAETGKAEFGVSGSGQIVLDPETEDALLFSGNFFERKADGSIDFEHETGEGMIINLSKPEIRFGSNGFYVHPNGKLEIGSADGEPTNFGGWQVLDNEFRSKNDSQIGTNLNLHLVSAVTGQTPGTYKSGYIYYGDHNTINSEKDGFYLGSDGISIDNIFRIVNSTLTLGKVNGDNKWEIKYEPKTDDHDERAYIAYKCSDVCPLGENLNSKESIYIGTNGVSLGRLLKYDNENTKIYFGNLNKKYFTINANTSSLQENSHISYNTEVLLDLVPSLENPEKLIANNPNDSIYIGTNGISLGKQFKVTDTGKVEVGNIENPHWTINSKNLHSYIGYEADEILTSAYIQLAEIPNAKENYRNNTYRFSDGGNYFYLEEQESEVVTYYYRYNETGEKIYYTGACEEPTYISADNKVYHYYISTTEILCYKDITSSLSFGVYRKISDNSYVPENYAGEVTEVINNNVDDYKESVYIGTNGISVSNFFKVDKSEMLIGENNKKHWTVRGENGDITFNTNKLADVKFKKYKINNEEYDVYYCRYVDPDDTDEEIEGECYNIGSYWFAIEEEAETNPLVEVKSVYYKVGTYNCPSDSACLSTSGISIGHTFKVDKDELILGELNKPHWTMKTKSNHSFIAYNVEELLDTRNMVNPQQSESVYLGTDGISVGTIFKVNKKEMTIGDLNQKHWTIKSSSNHTYIAYNGTTLGGSSVYLGTDGISVGSAFKVTPDGILEVGNLNGSHWTIAGEDSKSYIKYSTVDEQYNNKQIYLGTDKVEIGLNGDSNFSVNIDGQVNMGVWKCYTNNSGNLFGDTVSDISIGGTGIILKSNGNEDSSTGMCIRSSNRFVHLCGGSGEDIFDTKGIYIGATKNNNDRLISYYTNNSKIAGKIYLEGSTEIHGNLTMFGDLIMSNSNKINANPLNFSITDTIGSSSSRSYNLREYIQAIINASRTTS